MGAALPDLDRAEFVRRLRLCAPVAFDEQAKRALDEEALNALWAHFRELRRWNPRLSLIGPGTAEEIVERHYGEALAALPLLDSAQSLLDIGSGGGFPGLVLAAARPDLSVTLVEAQERKWAFLESAVRRARLSCRCLNARVGAALEIQPVDLVTWRAVRLPPSVVADLAAVSERMLLWSGAEEAVPPSGWESARRVALTGSSRRRIVEWITGPKERPASKELRAP